MEWDTRGQTTWLEELQGLDLSLPDSSCQWSSSVNCRGRVAREGPGQGESGDRRESCVLWGIQGKPSAQPSRTYQREEGGHRQPGAGPA